eukprot:TRINITY_DN110369_c0_g1_i1.p1 TRINITY_DN110369_c0_g1~~TRINITY_DN110369_c0_g1_i1.p1  ORF type:complete len:339 (+),score=36.86 TRINITY_DN110369_c0_g1_i1:141-1157(+)
MTDCTERCTPCFALLASFVVMLEALSEICHSRPRGALVTLSISSELDDAMYSTRLWVADDEFIDQAIVLSSDISQRRMVPLFTEVVEGTDCDVQWSWHVNPSGAFWVDLSTEVCDATPQYIEDHKEDWIRSPGAWCPWGIKFVNVTDNRDVKGPVLQPSTTSKTPDSATTTSTTTVRVSDSNATTSVMGDGHTDTTTLTIPTVTTTITETTTTTATTTTADESKDPSTATRIPSSTHPPAFMESTSPRRTETTSTTKTTSSFHSSSSELETTSEHATTTSAALDATSFETSQDMTTATSSTTPTLPNSTMPWIPVASASGLGLGLCTLSPWLLHLDLA